MKEHKCLIAFVAQYGNNYIIMPYSYINCLAVHSRFINKIFSDTFGKYVVVYLENILVFTEGPVRNLLQHLHKKKLYSKLEKHAFDFPKLNYLE